MGPPCLLPVPIPRRAALFFSGSPLSLVGQWEVLEIALGTPTPFKQGCDLEPFSSPSGSSRGR